MCIRKAHVGLVLIGIGLGLAVSFLLCGWFWRAVLALGLLIAGFALACG